MLMDDQAKKPIVSVVMPAYNAEKFVRQAIESVQNQTVSDWELFVIDDCSSDGTFSAAEQAAKGDDRIVVLRNDQNSGVSRTRNRGIDLAKGEYIAFLDSDDFWHPEKLYKQLEKIKKDKAQICYCAYTIVGADGNKVRADYLVPEQMTFQQLLKENSMQCSAMMIQADVLKKTKFKTEYFHEDYILGLDLLRSGCKAVGCSELLLNWRYIEGSRSFNKAKSAKNRWKIYRDYLKLPILQSVMVFGFYTFGGFRKYFRKAD